VYVDDVIERFLQLMDGADACTVDAGGFDASVHRSTPPQWVNWLGRFRL
jgi:hypothetical protein